MLKNTIILMIILYNLYDFFDKANVEKCVPVVAILPHTNFTFFRRSSKDIDGCCSATRYAIELKIVLEQRAFIPYNISKAQPKRLRNKKVSLISPLTFFLEVHGTIDV